MDPFTIAGLVSGGLGFAQSLHQPDPHDIYRQNLAQQAEVDRFNNAQIGQRTAGVMSLAGAANQRLGMSRQYTADEMAALEGQLQFAGQQGRLAARTGARGAQAQLRRQLGSGGDVFAATMSAGTRTGQAYNQSNLRQMAMDAARRAGQTRAQQEANMFMQQAGLLGQMPMQQRNAVMDTGFDWQAQAQQHQQRTNLWGNMTTGLGYLGQQGAGANLFGGGGKKDYSSWYMDNANPLG